MTKTHAEQLEYSRGYQRGRNRVLDHARKAFALAKRFRDEAKACRIAAWGKANWVARECQTCERWTRGGDSCHWGYCKADFLWEVGEPKMWTEPEADILTGESFVCCSYLSKNPLRSPEWDQQARDAVRALTTP